MDLYLKTKHALQGISAEKTFHGKSTRKSVRLLYKESASLFSKAIRSNLEPGEYNLADLGSHKGEFLQDLTKLLPEYTFKTIAVDKNADALKENNADQKIACDLSKLELADKSVDITIVRYAIAWNNLQNQKKILKEIKRITRHIAIIQHQGANPEYPENLRSAAKKLLGGAIPQLKRKNFFFSTPEQIEKFMRELKINFEMIQDRDVKDLSGVLIEKYNLSKENAHKVREILRNSDYVRQSAWILRF